MILIPLQNRKPGLLRTPSPQIYAISWFFHVYQQHQPAKIMSVPCTPSIHDSATGVKCFCHIRTTDSPIAQFEAQRTIHRALSSHIPNVVLKSNLLSFLPETQLVYEADLSSLTGWGWPSTFSSSVLELLACATTSELVPNSLFYLQRQGLRYPRLAMNVLW